MHYLKAPLIGFVHIENMVKHGQTWSNMVKHVQYRLNPNACFMLDKVVAYPNNINKATN